MANSIPDDQNSERSLSYLRAVGLLYDRAKYVHSGAFFLTVPLPIAIATIAVIIPSLRSYAALAGLLLSFADIVIIDELEKRCRKSAARIQEMFDCELLKLDWNPFRVGEQPMWEKIHRFSEKYKRKWNPLPKENWYSRIVGSIPLPAARLICQRTNLFWDSDLRRNYLIGLGVLISILFIGSILIGLSLSMSLSDFILSLMAPLFPTIIWLLKDGKKQWESAETLDRLKNRVSELWQFLLNNARTEAQLESYSRELQDEIFTHRCSNQPIFNLVYKLFRNGQEDEMNVAAEDLVKKLNP